MKKSILIAVAAITFYPCLGQKLATKIPNKAQYVVTINTPNILSKMSIAEMEKLPIVNKAVNSFVRKRKSYRSFTDADKSIGINDLGFDFSQKSYVFMEATDSITYFGYLIQLNSQSKFAALNDTSMQIIKNSKKLNIIGKRSKMIAWNKNMALFISSSKGYSYFKEHQEVYARYGIEIDTTGYNYKYYNYYKEQDKITKIWLQQKIATIFAKKSKKSASHKFLEYTDDKAALTAWSSPQNLYSQYLGTVGMHGISQPNNSFPGGDIVYHVYINKNDITMKSVISLDDKQRKSYKKMFDNPINPKFFDYIDANKNISYYSYAYSVKGVLEEMPQLINNYIGSSFDKWGIRESIDLLSVVIDEEAIGNVICGDGIFVLTNITSKEVTYTAYEWDEDFVNRTKVTKTKDEIIPEFLYMLSTKDEASINKIFKLSMKANKKLIKKEGYYSLELYNNVPFKIYFVVKDGIVFICNNEQQLQDILNNKKVNPLSADIIKTISSSPLQVYVDGKQITEKIPLPTGNSKRNKKNKSLLHYTKKNIGSISFQQNLTDKEGLTLKATYYFSNNAINGLTYFFNFFNDLYLIDKGDK